MAVGLLGAAGLNPLGCARGDRLAAWGTRLTPQRAALLVAGADRLRDQLRFNLNRTLIAESLLAGVAGGPIP